MATDSVSGEPPTVGEPLAEALRLIEAAGRADVPLRLMGGLAVQLRTGTWRPGRRAQRDIDLAAQRRDRIAITEIMAAEGYQADRRFNALHGHKQLYFVDPASGRPVDVLLDVLEMCHCLVFADRLALHPRTLSLADLLLSKLQIVRITHKDIVDILALLHEHELTPGTERGINIERVVQVTASDWGWWRTVTGNLATALKLLDVAAPEGIGPLPPPSRVRLEAQLRHLMQTVDTAPKSVRWRLRARIGERVRWYEEPEEETHV